MKKNKIDVEKIDNLYDDMQEVLQQQQDIDMAIIDRSDKLNNSPIDEEELLKECPKSSSSFFSSASSCSTRSASSRKRMLSDDSSSVTSSPVTSSISLELRREVDEIEMLETVVGFLKKLLLSSSTNGQNEEAMEFPSFELFIADLVRQIDSKTKNKSIKNASDLKIQSQQSTIGVMSLISASIFIERMLSMNELAAPRNQRSVYNLIAVASCVAIKILLDEHPGNRRLARMCGFEDVSEFNRLEAQFCVAVSFDFSISTELIDETRKRYSSLNKAITIM